MRPLFATIWLLWLLVPGHSFGQNPYYDHGTFPAPGTVGSSAAMRAELDLIEAGFAKLPALTGKANQIVVVNSSGTALEATSALMRGATGPTLPTTCTAGSLFIATDDVLGSVLYFCKLTDFWQPVALQETNTLQTVYARDRQITGATSILNCPLLGDATSGQCTYSDPADGVITEPVPYVSRAWRIPYGKKGYIWDVQGSKPMAEVAPNGIATGSGTFTMQTDQQLGVSNLGIELAESDTNPACASGNYTIYADASEATLKYCNNGIVYVPAQEVVLRKTVDQTVGNNTLTDDATFQFTAAANTVYAIKLFVMYSATTAADFQYTFTLPASATGQKASTSVRTDATSCSGTTSAVVNNDITVTNNNVGGIGTGAGNTCTLVIDATVVTAGTSGAVKWRWAQANNDASNATVFANSWMSYRRIP